eukprot:scaffold30345_cov90-Isochrysis_galbana.AAC.4
MPQREAEVGVLVVARRVVKVEHATPHKLGPAHHRKGGRHVVSLAGVVEVDVGRFVQPARPQLGRLAEPGAGAVGPSHGPRLLHHTAVAHQLGPHHAHVRVRLHRGQHRGQRARRHKGVVVHKEKQAAVGAARGLRCGQREADSRWVPRQLVPDAVLPRQPRQQRRQLSGGVCRSVIHQQPLGRRQLRRAGEERADAGGGERLAIVVADDDGHRRRFPRRRRALPAHPASRRRLARAPPAGGVCSGVAHPRRRCGRQARVPRHRRRSPARGGAPVGFAHPRGAGFQTIGAAATAAAGAARASIQLDNRVRLAPNPILWADATGPPPIPRPLGAPSHRRACGATAPRVRQPEYRPVVHLRPSITQTARARHGAAAGRALGPRRVEPPLERGARFRQRNVERHRRAGSCRGVERKRAGARRVGTGGVGDEQGDGPAGADAQAGQRADGQRQPEAAVVHQVRPLGKELAAVGRRRAARRKVRPVQQVQPVGEVDAGAGGGAMVAPPGAHQLQLRVDQPPAGGLAQAAQLKLQDGSEHVKTADAYACRTHTPSSMRCTSQSHHAAARCPDPEWCPASESGVRAAAVAEVLGFLKPLRMLARSNSIHAQPATSRITQRLRGGMAARRGAPRFGPSVCARCQ